MSSIDLSELAEAISEGAKAQRRVVDLEDENQITLRLLMAAIEALNGGTSLVIPDEIWARRCASATCETAPIAYTLGGSTGGGIRLTVRQTA